MRYETPSGKSFFVVILEEAMKNLNRVEEQKGKRERETERETKGSIKGREGKERKKERKKDEKIEIERKREG